MLALLGFLIVLAAVLGGYLLEHGNFWVLMQPAELLIIGGGATGILLVANSPAVIRKMFRGSIAIFRSQPYTRATYLLDLRMLYEIFGFAQRAGLPKLEGDVEEPEKSPIFSRYPDFLRDEEARNFVCDSMRMLVVGISGAQQLETLMDMDIQVQRRGRKEPVHALQAIADALPGLGIVAAVLGVVITMEAIGGSPETVGQKVAAALVGTFLGILLCYGVVGPMAARLDGVGGQRLQAMHVMRTAIVAFARGEMPILCVEYARRSIPVEMRPSFIDLEQTIRREAKIPVVQPPQGSEVRGRAATA